MNHANTQFITLSVPNAFQSSGFSPLEFSYTSFLNKGHCVYVSQAQPTYELIDLILFK